MTPAEAEEYTQSLGQIFAGSYRQIAWAIQQGVPQALGLPVEEWGRRLEGRIKLGIEERRAAARELADEGMSQREIGAALGVGHGTIDRDLNPPAPDGAPEFADLADLNPPAPDGAPDRGDATRLVQSNENDWHTPPRYIEAARAVLGGIDLDPASSTAANATVRAVQFYSQDENGLAKPWKGRIWLNPPYGRRAGEFIIHLCNEYRGGTITAAIALVNAHCTDTAWFQALWEHTLCFTDHRIDFDAGGRSKNTGSTHGSVFAYLGPDPLRFAEAFRHFGAVVRRIP